MWISRNNFFSNIIKLKKYRILLDFYDLGLDRTSLLIYNQYAIFQAYENSREKEVPFL